MHLRYHSNNVHCYESTEVRSTVGAAPGPNSKDQSNIYSMRSGIFLVIVLLFVLGWMPVIGHAIAGYVGGRRSGSPIKGLISGLIGVTIVASTITFVMTLMSPYFSQSSNGLEVWAATITENSNFQQMFNTVLVSGKNFFTSIDLTMNHVTSITVASFGIVGGIIADQTQKETHIVSIDTSKATVRTARSIDLYKNNKEVGFEFYKRCMPVSVNSLAVSAKSEKSQLISETDKTEP